MKKIKIFLTVGTHPAPFNRIVKMLDDFANTHSKEYEIIAQIGPADPPTYIKNWFRICSFNEFRKYIDQADIIIAHAGAGSVITALSRGKPIIIIPRRMEFGEVNDNNQLELSKKMEEINGVEVIYDPENIDMKKLDKRIHKLLKTFKPFKSKEKEKLEKNLLRWLKEQEGDI